MAVLAGLVVSNSGTIKNCYTIWNKKYNSKMTLISSNTGQLQTSALIAKGTCEEIYDDTGRISQDYSIQKTSDIKKLGFDVQNTWEYVGENNLIRFQNSNWHIRVDKSNRQEIHIKSVDDYIEFAAKVNGKVKKYIDAYVYLECDLNFKGKNIPIVGTTRECAFNGVFEGKNHLIWNGTIKDDKALYVGLFGYMKGVVANLIFDGRVQSDKNLAGICGVNMGLISCCGSVVRLKPKDERYNAAGVVVNNEGTLDRCYSLLQKQMIIPPFVYVLLIALIAILLGIIGYFTIVAALNSGQDYAKIEVDPGQEKTDDYSTEPGKENAFSFALSEDVEISRMAQICKLNFTNPANDTHKLVVELQVINNAGERVNVGSSKAVSPGYSIKSLPITNASALTGSETQGYVVLIPYDNVTENKSKVQSELPVKIKYTD